MIQLLAVWGPMITVFLGGISLLQIFYWQDQEKPDWSAKIDRGFLLALAVTSLAIKGVEWTLTVATFALLVGYAIDKIFFQKKRTRPNTYADIIKEYVWLMLVIWLVRSFIIQPYRVPSGSLEPTISPGDFLLVNQFSYGFRFPIWNHEFYSVGLPKRGDIAVFYYPNDPEIRFVKRVIGLPGDHIQYKYKRLYINGKEVARRYLKPSQTIDNPIQVEQWQENLAGKSHDIYINPEYHYNDYTDVVVPKDQYFVMGDNRDGSHDSRFWGFVPRSALVGKAFLVWLSVDLDHWAVRFNRMGQWL